MSSKQQGVLCLQVAAAPAAGSSLPMPARGLRWRSVGKVVRCAKSSAVSSSWCTQYISPFAPQQASHSSKHVHISGPMHCISGCVHCACSAALAVLCRWQQQQQPGVPSTFTFCPYALHFRLSSVYMLGDLHVRLRCAGGSSSSSQGS
jgi:hypothetical protein